MLTATGLTMTFGPQTLFEGADLQLDAGRRYGIVGANGSGKSTLLRILAGQQLAAAGEIGLPRGCRVGVLDQDHFRFEEVPIIDVVMMGHTALWAAMREKEALLAQPEFDEQRYGELEDVIMHMDGYGLEARAEQILEGLGIPATQHHQPLRVLSGGFKLRALMGQTLASEPDLLLLDEPTNHLDILAIRWLEQYLQRFSGCAVVVSHDLQFLDEVCTDILDIDYERITAYPGSWTKFTSLKTEARRRQESEIAKRETEIAKHKAFVARFKAQANKARQARSRQGRVEKMVIEPLPRSSRRRPTFRFQARRRAGQRVLAVQGISKAFGDNRVLNEVAFEVQRGDRVAIIGPNGIGKSTLLKILVGELEADAGTVTWGHEADFGYFPQDHHEALGDPDQTLKSAMWDACPQEDLGGVLGRLAAVLFSRDDTDKRVGDLSGGEAARLLFSRIAVQKPTVMVLDEPTNHLDIESIGALSQALRRYDGTIILVSHDRWFVDKLATRVLEVRADGLRDYRGSYREYTRRGTMDHLHRGEVIKQARRQRKAKKKGR
jgi:ATPase subunit of ABC transporter with duplicated ATPase domains